MCTSPIWQYDQYRHIDYQKLSKSVNIHHRSNNMTADLCLIGGLVSPNINFDALKAGLSRSSWYMTSPMPASSISFVHSLHGCRVTYTWCNLTRPCPGRSTAHCARHASLFVHTINQVNKLLKWSKWHSHWKDHWLGDVSKLHQDMIAGIKRNVFN